MVTLSIRSSLTMPLPDKAPMFINSLFFVCGVSVYARGEAFLFQTVLFSDCFGIGVFYFPIASCLSFPGLLIQIMEARSTTGGGISANCKFSTLQLCTHNISVVGQTFCVGLYFDGIDWVSDLRGLGEVSALLSILGVTSAIQWSYFCKLFSYFPNSCQACFYWQYASFLFYIPVNVLLKDLCSAAGLFEMQTTTVFFGVSSGLTLFGGLSVVIIVCSAFGSKCCALYSVQHQHAKRPIDPMSLPPRRPHHACRGDVQV